MEPLSDASSSRDPLSELTGGSRAWLFLRPHFFPVVKSINAGREFGKRHVLDLGDATLIHTQFPRNVAVLPVEASREA
jgi:hypothetical protein